MTIILKFEGQWNTCEGRRNQLISINLVSLLQQRKFAISSMLDLVCLRSVHSRCNLWNISTSKFSLLLRSKCQMRCWKYHHVWGGLATTTAVVSNSTRKKLSRRWTKLKTCSMSRRGKNLLFLVRNDEISKKPIWIVSEVLRRRQERRDLKSDKVPWSNSQI